MGEPRYIVESDDGQLLAETDSLFLALRTLAEDGEKFPVQITDRRYPTRPITGHLDSHGQPVVRV